MPLRRTTKHGKPAYQWGSRGKKASYTPGNKASRNAARRRALADRGRIEFYRRRRSGRGR
jgi:hypothetical protein